MKLILLLLCLALSGCDNTGWFHQDTVQEVQDALKNKQDDFSISDHLDGWLYFSNDTTGEEIMRFRIKGKTTSWDDFDVELLRGKSARE